MPTPNTQRPTPFSALVPHPSALIPLASAVRHSLFLRSWFQVVYCRAPEYQAWQFNVQGVPEVSGSQFKVQREGGFWGQNSSRRTGQGFLVPRNNAFTK